MISCDPLDHNGTGVGVDARHPEAREPIIAPPAPLTRRHNVAVTRPTDGEGRIALFDHAGHLGPHALRQVLVERERRYPWRNCDKQARERDSSGCQYEKKISFPLFINFFLRESTTMKLSVILRSMNQTLNIKIP